MFQNSKITAVAWAQQEASKEPTRGTLQTRGWGQPGFIRLHSRLPGSFEHSRHRLGVRDFLLQDVTIRRFGVLIIQAWYVSSMTNWFHFGCKILLRLNTVLKAVRSEALVSRCRTELGRQLVFLTSYLRASTCVRGAQTPAPFQESHWQELDHCLQCQLSWFLCMIFLCDTSNCR